MKRVTNFKHLSSKAAKRAAIEDMKKDEINHSVLYNQHRILNQPILAFRVGLLGL